MPVLYRKYRPQTFAEVFGQKHIVETLKNQVKAGQIAHAYLFTGSRGLGKTSMARILAKAVNCTQPDIAKPGDACGNCESCRAIAAGTFLDLVEIDAASNTGVDNIRDLIEHVKFSPAIGKYKVFIIDEVHMLSKGAFAALLKTLEEPPAHAIFILATTESAKVPATIVSRTQRFDFHKFSVEELERQLAQIVKAEKVKLSEEIIGLIADRAEGGARDALSLLDKVLTLGDNPDITSVQRLLGFTEAVFLRELLAIIGSGKTQDVPPFFSQLLERGIDAALFNRDFLEYLRKVLVYKTAPASLPQGARDEKLAELAGAFTLPRLIFITRLFLKSLKDLPGAPSPDIPLLLAALEACNKNEGADKAAAKNQKAPEPAEVSVSYSPPMVKIEAGSQPEEQDYDQAVTLDEVEKIWPLTISRLKASNGPLANLVRTSPLAAVRAGQVVLAVRYRFHKQNLENAKNARLICDLLYELLQKRVGLMAEVVKKEPEKSPSGEILGDALKVFGGELIE